MKRIDAQGRRVLIIPDTHIPYHHVDAWRFLGAVKDKYLDHDKKGRLLSQVIHLGDELDKHAISFHDSDSELFSAGHELEVSKEEIHKKGGLYELFPDLNILESNHGSLVYRRAKHHGIPLEYFKSYEDVLETPGWSWHEDIVLETRVGPIYLCHGKTANYGKLCKEEGMSAIQGHFHGKFEVTWHKTKLSERFNCFAGCLINRDSMAFHYGKNHLPKAILGCVLISSSGYPRLIKMTLDDKGRWNKKLP